MTPSLPVYLDNHATTRVDPRVVGKMLPYFSEVYGNAASRQHEFGWRAEAAVNQARRQVASLIGAGEQEIVFTSGATESINLAIKGIAEGYRDRGNHVVTVATEHQAVLGTCETLERAGWSVSYLSVDRAGRFSMDELRSALSEKTILVSVMAANNEIGTVAPLAEIGRLCHERGILFHTDAAQAAGKIPLDVRSMNIDLMSLTAHKLYGPKGVGALYIRKAAPRIPVTPMIDGGGHEQGFRSGTLNVPGIVGVGEATAIARLEMDGEAQRVGELRDLLVEGILSTIEDSELNGDMVGRLPGNASISFAGVRADKILLALREIAVSTGSACSSAVPRPSHVLRALGLDDDQALSSIRFGIGRFNTVDEIRYTLGRLAEVVVTIRKQSPSHHHALS